MNLAGRPQDGLSCLDWVLFAVLTANPALALCDAEQLPPPAGVAPKHAARRHSRDVRAEVGISVEPGCFNEMDSGARVFFQDALIKLNPFHAATL